MSEVPVSKEAVIDGSIKMERVWCSDCGQMALVRGRRKLCCLGDSPEGAVKRVRREVDPVMARRLPSLAIRRRILELQRECCFYCDRRFGSFVWRKTRRRERLMRLRVEWDHAEPWTYGYNNHNENFVAACQVCNQLKSNTMFSTREEAIVYLATSWQRHGYVDV